MAELQLTADEELMRRVKAGGRQDLSALMRRYANSLLTFLRRMTGDHHRSEELFQEVFLAVWIQRSEYDHPRSFRTWLFGIAVNKSRSDLRSRLRRPVTVDSDQVGCVAQGSESPHDAAVATETATIVQNAVLQLPDLQREVLVLRVWNGMSYLAIGQILGRTESTVRSHMFHAVNSMRASLEPRLRERES